MKTFKLTIEYDGTGYHGWQTQAEDITLQETIEKALTVMTREKIRIAGSGRTDAGVHAYAQVASFKTRAAIPAHGFQAGLNSLLPNDIVIKACEPAKDNFHARFSARNKTYQYRIYNHPLPIAVGRQYAWHIRKNLDVGAMEQAAGHIIGTHDFKSFEGTGSPRDHTVRTLTNATLSKTDDGYVVFNITANGFLRYMVRNLTGTLADVGLGKTSAERFRQILDAKNRKLAGATAPPQGLFLMNVGY